ncbi:DUF1294 domain-containing protein [Blautia sp. MSJ-19]|uniref:DUF1294 domain-containing protein n=1 Tax=Blautia sp. MSJ-19 TaxID=2841517 RepID=UPI001C0F25AE|nr:DUF1294 domain-containing protein [Blautia sp. MSJ-19]MBU5480415.1 DUF1294 domain-containing protein [Blautia sp. MSJ-19]
MLSYLYFYLAGINIVTFLLYGSDKNRARRHAWRIPERTLLELAVIGGGFGALLGMIVFHHKTRKPKFYIGVPLILVVEIALAVLYWKTGRPF